MTGNGERPTDGVLSARIEEVAGEVATVRRGVGELSEAIAALAVQAARVRPIHWPDLQTVEHAERYGELLAWMREVFVERYAVEAEALTECWWRHPAAVDLLTATWQSWVMVYRNPASGTGAAVTWQQVTLPTTTARLRLLLGNCQRQHVDDPDVRAMVTGGWG